MEEYRRRSIIIGKEITVISGSESYPARAVDIDDRGGLVVEKKDGSKVTLQSGEITIRGDFLE